MLSKHIEQPIQISSESFAGILVGVLMLPSLIYAGCATTDQLVRLFPDDAFYYLQIAWNIARHGHVSFDGLHITNGFHPLQMLVSVMFAFSGDKVVMMRAVVLENAFCLCLSSVIVARYFAAQMNMAGQTLLAAVISLPVAYLYLWLDAGMEMGLVLLFGVLSVQAWMRAIDGGLRDAKTLRAWALWSSCFLLSRLDMVIPLAIFAVAMFMWAIYMAASVRIFVKPALILCFAMLPVLAWNILIGGSPVPVSALVKIGGQSDWHANWRALTSGSAAGTLFIASPAVLVVLAGLFERERIGRLLILLFAITLAVWYAYILFVANQVFRWYLAYPYVIQLLASGMIARGIMSRWALFSRWSLFPRWLPVLSGAACVLVMSMQAGIYAWTTRLPTTSLYLKQVADNLNERVGNGDVLAVFDAGVIGYFTHARVINLDGLVNSRDYLEHYLKPANFQEYFQQNRLDWLLLRRGMVQSESPDGLIRYRFMEDPRVMFDASQLAASYENQGPFDLILFRLKR